MDLLRLLGSSDLAGADSPDGLVGDDHLLPGVGAGAEGGAEGVELAGNDGQGVAGLALGQGLAAAPDDADAAVEGELGLGGDVGVALAQDGAPLRVAQDGPGDVAVLELRHADLAGEGAVGLVEYVLGGHLDLGVEVLSDEEEVEGRRGDDDLCGSI